MTNMILFGAAPPWMTAWLTPIWLLGLGAAIGLAAAVALWGLLLVAARIPAIGTLAEKPAAKRLVVSLGTAVLLIVYFWFGYTQLSAEAVVEGAARGSNSLVSLLLFSPICWLIPYSLVALMHRRNVDELPLTLREGAMWPIGWIVVGVAACSLLGFFVVPNPQLFLESLSRIPHAGTTVLAASIPAAAENRTDLDAEPPFHAVVVSFRRDELQKLGFFSSENLEILMKPPSDEDLARTGRLEVTAGANYFWNFIPQLLPKIFPEPHVSNLYVRNLGSKAAQLKITIQTAAPVPQVATVPIVAVAVFVLLLSYVLQRTLMPRVSAVALATFKSETAQPLFPIITVLGVFLLFTFVVIPYNTFGEDIKMLKDAGVKLIMVLTIIQAVWGASTSISEEVDGRTALTVLSKPISRSSFIIGKFLGIAWTVMLMFVIFGVIFLAIVAYKPLYDAREGGFEAKEYGALGYGNDEPTWQICHLEMTSVSSGIVLAGMETIILTAISVAISTRLPMLANFIICFTIYVLGNLTPMIVKSSVGQFEIVQFVGQLIATIVPNLENFDIQAAVASGQVVPLFYLGWTFLYGLIYTLIAMLIALFLFEDRDLA